MVFLLFAVQLLFGLYARTTITAIGSDVAAEAATAVARGAHPADYAGVVRDRLGSYGDDADISVRLDDTDGDGVADTVAVTIDAALPTLLPSQWLPVGSGRVERTMNARIETFQATP